MIELYLLEQLSAVRRCGTLSAASEELHLTQPTLSRSMKKLESELGVELFTHEKNKVTLNDTGELAADYADRLLQQEEDMERRIRAFDRSKRTISLGSCAPGPVNMLYPMLNTLYGGNSVLTELTDPDDLREGLYSDRYQLIVLDTPAQEDDIFCVHCIREDLSLCVMPGHPAASRKDISFRDMDGETFLMASDIGLWADLVRQEMPHSKFLLQSDTDSLGELVRHSSLPCFSTNLARFLPSPDWGARVNVPFSDATASVDFYLIGQKKDQKRFLTLLQRLKDEQETAARMV